MTLQEIEKRLQELENTRLKAKEEGAALKELQAELLETQEFDNKLAAMKPLKRQKFLKKLGKTEQEIAEIEAKLPVRNVQHADANITDIGVKVIS